MPDLWDSINEEREEIEIQQKIDKKPDKKSKAKTHKKQKKPEDISKLMIDELRAYYIVICRKRPKHNSKQGKDFLINEIIKVLNLSKKEVM